MDKSSTTTGQGEGLTKGMLLQGMPGNVDKNQFFREATIRLCGSLDIQDALRNCSDYIGRFIPLIQMYVMLFDPNLSAIRVISSVIHRGVRGIKPIRIPEKYMRKWTHDWEGYVIMNDQDSEEWFWDHVRAMGVAHNVSILLVRLKIRGQFACLSLVGEGQGVYTEKHAELILLLKEPLAAAISNALQYEEVLRLKDMLAEEQRALYRQLKGHSDYEFVYSQTGMKDVMEMCRQIAPLDSPVLLLGETGTGKDLLANIIHDYSTRNQGPFVAINCGAMTETLLDSELFGHEKGAFTGAICQKMGRFERANKGTIFLDEIGELSPQGQVRLLRVLQYKEIERVGGTNSVPVDTRIIAATNRNLEDLVKSGTFRLDLYFRLNVFPITLPTLRERRMDIHSLVHHFIEQKRRELRLDITPRLSPTAIDKLVAYDWPGNVRELQNIVERALIRNNNGYLNFEELLTLQALDVHQGTPPIHVTDKALNLDETVLRLISSVLKQTNGKINGPGGAAELLGIHPNTLRKKMDKLGITYGRSR